MLTCRKCQEPADTSRREWGNEFVSFIYEHRGGRQHTIQVEAYQAEAIAAEDRRQMGSQ